MRKYLFFILIALNMALMSCSGTDKSSEMMEETSAGSCVNMCTTSGFTSGSEVDFGSGVIECQCEGTGNGIEQDQCTSYCSDFNVDANNAFVTSENSADDKCVCDGTAN